MEAKETGGARLIDGLRRRGVDTVFGLPGVQLDGLFDALAGAPDIRVVHSRHEQGAAYMADGYARAGGGVGVCAVVPGPGVLNAGAALVTAYANHSPVLLIAGHLFGGDRALGTGALHEIPSQESVLRGAIDHSVRVRAIDEIDPAIDAAFARMHGNPPRPAAIEIGPDILLADAEGQEPAEPILPPPPPEIDGESVERAAAALATARRPVILAGGGARQAGAGLAALAEALAAPVVLTSEGKGALDASKPGVLPPALAFPLLEEADAVVVVGSRFQASRGPHVVADDATIVFVDLDADRLERSATGHEGPVHRLWGDAGPAATTLASAVADLRAPDPERDRLHRARVEAHHQAVLEGLPVSYPDTWELCRALRRAIPADGVLVDEMTQVGYMARNAYPAAEGRTYIGAGYQGTLGFGYPTALGAKVARPEAPVVSISGDGGFLYNVGELATARHHDIGVVAVVFVDGAYGNVRGIQQRVYGREIASTLTNPDLVGLAQSFDIRGRTADGPEELEVQLREAIEAGEPALIAVPIDPQPDTISSITGRHRFPPASGGE